MVQKMKTQESDGKVSASEIPPPSKQKEKNFDDNQMEEDGDDDEDDYDEQEDEDYDPEAPVKDGQAVIEGVEGEEEEEESNDESDNDAGKETAAISEVKTRSQRIEAQKLPQGVKKKSLQPSGLIKDETRLDVDSIFNDLKEKSGNLLTDKDQHEHNIIPNEDGKEQTDESQQQSILSNPNQSNMEPNQIKIETSYSFAGKLITESKLVDADSAEAKAYLNSTNILNNSIKDGDREVKSKSSIPIIRTLPNTETPIELRIKLKRPSLIDKFLSSYNSKKQKLSTLEKSRLDWASFVDQRKIKDDLSIHNKAGYLDKQEFLGRLDVKRDEQYVKAREEDRKQQWQLQQQGK